MKRIIFTLVLASLVLVFFYGCENYECIDKHAYHSNNALLVRSVYICKSVCVGRGAHTGFVREESPLCALAYGDFKRRTDTAADNGIGLKGVFENKRNCFGQIFYSDNNNRKCT